MTSRNFIKRSLAIVLLGAAIFGAMNASIDVYGLFRDTRGRQIKVYYQERMSKYLFAHRYIPENFDGLLIGSSASDNFETALFLPQKIYNLSVDGANAAELGLIAGEAFKKRRFNTVIFCINQYLMTSSGRKTSYIDPQDYWSALGSPQLVMTYFSKWLIDSGRKPDLYAPNGVFRFERRDSIWQPMHKLIANELKLIRSGQATQKYALDPRGIADFSGMLQAAERNASQVVGFVMPLPEEILEATKNDRSEFIEVTKNIFGERKIIDFNTQKYQSFRVNYDHYRDQIHLSEKGAEQLMRLLMDEMRRI